MYLPYAVHSVSTLRCSHCVYHTLFTLYLPYAVRIVSTLRCSHYIYLTLFTLYLPYAVHIVSTLRCSHCIYLTLFAMYLPYAVHSVSTLRCSHCIYLTLFALYLPYAVHIVSTLRCSHCSKVIYLTLFSHWYLRHTIQVLLSTLKFVLQLSLTFLIFIIFFFFYYYYCYYFFCGSTIHNKDKPHPTCSPPSCATCLQLTILVFLTSLSTSAYLLVLGRFRSKLAWYVFLVFLASSDRCRRPTRVWRLSLMNVLMLKTFYLYIVKCTDVSYKM